MQEHFGQPRPVPERLPRLGPSFAPIACETDGAVVEFSRREAPKVDLTPEGHLMCVNFSTMRDSLYRYAGGREVRGTRHLGSAHLIAAGHRLEAHTPDPTDHVVLKIAPERLRLVGEGLFDGAALDLRTDGLPFFDASLFHIARDLRRELADGNPNGRLAVEEAATRFAARLRRSTPASGGESRSASCSRPPASPECATMSRRTSPRTCRSTLSRRSRA
jgi:hypothetical protein